MADCKERLWKEMKKSNFVNTFGYGDYGADDNSGGGGVGWRWCDPKQPLC